MKDNKRKATIVTIYDPMPNIGNRLQNYAAQELLKKLNLEVDTLSFQRSAMPGKKKLKYFAQKITNFRLPGDTLYWKLFPQRIKAFEKFNKRYIKTQHINKISQIKPADYFVVGSDQVWNPHWYSDCDLKKDLFLLDFAKDNQKVCLSPSFSLKALPDEWKEWFKSNLSSFPKLAVRENEGAKIIKDLINKEATVTIDPTLVLDKDEWNKISLKPQNINCNKNYILTYFLGGRSDYIEKDLKKYANEIGADIYHLLDMNQPDLYIIDPANFLYLVAHANLVVTDSFHACVFAFLYNKPFLVYNRQGEEDMMSRLNTLLSKFSLERKYVDSGLANELFECDYKEGYIILEQEKKKLIDYLKKTMHL